MLKILRTKGELGSKQAAPCRCAVKKVFLNVSQNLQEKTYQSLFFNKVAGLRPLKKKLQHFLTKLTLQETFHVNFAKFLKTPFFIEHFQWLLLNLV